MEFKLGELFCGPGGLALAAGLAGKTGISSKSKEKFTIKHLWGVDKDIDAINTYRNNIIKKFGGEGICKDAFEFVNSMTQDQKKINALAFGFPCNDFSSVGNQTGFGGKFGILYQAGIKAISITNPIWFIAENVSGINSADGGKAFQTILAELENAGKGYDITPHLYKFEEYGVPQLRHRFIIVGIRKDYNLTFKVPATTTEQPEKQKTAQEALEGITPDMPNSSFSRMSQNVINRLKLTPPGKNAWFLDELIEKPISEIRSILQTTSWYKDVFLDISDDDIINMIRESKLNCKSARMSHIYRRLQADRPAYTITGSGGGGTHVYHWCEHRSLSNRERARLQTFPDWFEFSGSQEKVRKQIGMAVPTEGAKIIFDSILKTFAQINYKTVNKTQEIYHSENVIVLEKKEIQKLSIKKLKEKIITICDGLPQYRYSDSIVVTAISFCDNKCNYEINNHIYSVSISVIKKVIEFYRKQKQITENNLQLQFPEFFNGKEYKEFFVISLLESLELGIKNQPYTRLKMWALQLKDK